MGLLWLVIATILTIWVCIFPVARLLREHPLALGEDAENLLLYLILLSVASIGLLLYFVVAYP